MGAVGNPPKDFCTMEDALRCLMHSLAYGQQSVFQSAQNLNLTSAEFIPQDRTWPLDNAGDMSIPLWMERFSGTSPYETWFYIPAVNKSSIESSYIRGEQKCAFFTQDQQFYVTFSYNPQLYVGDQQRHRVWYSPNVLLPQVTADTALDSSVTSIPENLAPYFICKAGLRLLALMQTKAAMLKEPPTVLMKAWESLALSMENDAVQWSPLFNQFVFGERGSRRGRRRRPILYGSSDGYY